MGKRHGWASWRRPRRRCPPRPRGSSSRQGRLECPARATDRPLRPRFAMAGHNPPSSGLPSSSPASRWVWASPRGSSPPRPEPVAQTEPIDYCTAAKATAATPFRTSTCRPSGGGPYICIYCSNVPAECTCDTGDGDPGSASTAPRLCGPRSSRDLIRPGDGDGGRNRPECPRCGPVISERCKVCADWFDRDMREARRRQSRLADAKDGGVPPKAPPRLFRRPVASATPPAQPTRPVGTPRTRLGDEPSSSTKPQGSWV